MRSGVFSLLEGLGIPSVNYLLYAGAPVPSSVYPNHRSGTETARPAIRRLSPRSDVSGQQYDHGKHQKAGVQGTVRRGDPIRPFLKPAFESVYEKPVSLSCGP